MKQGLRNAIIRGRIKAEEQLPAFPEVARQFRVAAPTAKRAIDELVKEGWLTTRNGVGTFVRIRRSDEQIILTAPREYASEAFFSIDTLDAFHAEHPHVRILMSAESETDLLVTDSYGLVIDRVRQGRWQSLDDLLRRFVRDEWVLPQNMARFGTFDGELYGLPMRASLMALQINPDLLRRRGVTVPEQFMTWDAFQEIHRRCREDRDGDGIFECFGSFSQLEFREWLVPFWQRGGRLDDREAFFRPEAICVLDDLCRMHHMDDTFPIEMTLGGEVATKEAWKRMCAGKVAMRWIGTREIFRAAPVPTEVLLPNFGPVGRQMAVAVLLGVHGACEHPEVALDFLEFCHKRFVAGNAEYPFGLGEKNRQTLREQPALIELLREGLDAASEALQEGAPERTWAIEHEIYQWFRLFQDRKTTMVHLEDHWRKRKESASAVPPREPHVGPLRIGSRRRPVPRFSIEEEFITLAEEQDVGS